ncbi:WXG100 family type VII secretion target [Kitasatospora sp. NPDC036755]|uniref:WXG100 family type VII secretion target n=1 Tax=Kitasatospora sp. NPDC036755 TaxID=3154600 RepID=UPI0033D5F770
MPLQHHMDDYSGTIHLHHETVAQAVADLRKSGKDMSDGLTELIGKLTALTADGAFQGAAAGAFEELKVQVNNNQTAMNQDIDFAANTLATMHEIMSDSDLSAKKQFG